MCILLLLLLLWLCTSFRPSHRIFNQLLCMQCSVLGACPKPG